MKAGIVAMENEAGETGEQGLKKASQFEKKNIRVDLDGVANVWDVS